MRTPAEATQAWLERAEQQHDPFDRFIALWVAFNVLYGSLYRETERQAIGDYLYSHRPPRRIIKQILDRPAVLFFHHRIIRDVRSLHDPHRGIRDTFEAAITLRAVANPPAARLVALVRILYQVRCNLFHGQKLYDREADEEVVTNAAEALLHVLRVYLYPGSAVP